MDRSVERERWTGGGDEIVVLHGVSWDEYHRQMRERERAMRKQPRMAYLDGSLELVTRGQRHEYVKSHLGRLLEVYMLESGVDFTPVGEWTQRSRLKRAGVEPDECYVFKGDLERRRRVDLAIEVVVTSGGVSKLEIYRRLGIKEVWFWTERELQIYVLRRGRFSRARRSRWLPEVDLDHLLEFLDLRPTSAAIRAYRKALQAQRR